MAQALTPALVAAASCPAGRAQVDLFDSVVPGLALRIGLAGKKTWTLLYRSNGTRKRISVGNAALMSLAAARQAARQILGGRAPATRVAKAETFGDLCRIFLERGDFRPKTETIYRHIIESKLLPAWRLRLVASLTRSDILSVLDPIVGRGARVMANRTRQLIVTLLNLSIDRGWTDSNVATHVRRPGGKEHSRDRTLTLSEVTRLWLALDSEKPATAAVIRFLILTGQRMNEVLGLDWSEIDLEACTWDLPGERAKNRRAHSVPLGPTAMAILETIKADTGHYPQYPRPASNGRQGIR
jgi:integrase